MRSIRKLYLQNASGERWDLNGTNGVYCTDLSGFGFTLETDFSNIGCGFFQVPSDNADAQSNLAFTVVFAKNAYITFQTFADWLADSEKLSIVYNPTGTQEYYRDIVVSFVEKGELNGVGWLECPCSFYALTPWYRPIPTSLSVQSSGKDERKLYNYRYTDSFKYGLDSSSALSATVVGSGHIPAAIELFYYGAIKNPQIKLTGNISGNTFGVCSISSVFSDADILVVSTKYEKSFVKKIAADGIESDLLNDLNLNLKPFFRIPINEPCTISIESDDFFTGRAELAVYYYYRSV